MQSKRFTIIWSNVLFLFMSIELLLYWLNRDVYFQLSGFYIPLLVGLIIGLPSLRAKMRHIKLTNRLIALLVFLLELITVSFFRIERFETGYFFTYLLAIILLFETEIGGIDEYSQIMIGKSYIYGASIIAIIQIVFRTRYYAMTASRITIQVFNNPKIDPNYLAAFMIAPFFLCALEFTEASKIRKKTKYAILCALIFLGIFLTGSRGSILAVLLGFAYALYKINKERLRVKYIIFAIIVIIAGGVVITRFVPYETLSRLFYDNYFADSGNVRRMRIWANAWQSIKKSPIIGHGITNSMYITGTITGLYEPAHNTFFDIWLQTGIIGLFSLGVLLIQTLKNVNPFIKAIALSSIICSVFIGAEACLYFWVNIWICLYFCREKNQADKGSLY